MAPFKLGVDAAQRLEIYNPGSLSSLLALGVTIPSSRSLSFMNIHLWIRSFESGYLIMTTSYTMHGNTTGLPGIGASKGRAITLTGWSKPYTVPPNRK
mmetsp:Transcript_6952/g.10200  ORF Transcript_6952/g.10200 Transcript_6952/m.10200 type:complete len:98 (-) Transcript_6952:337-630(-)